MDEFDELLAGVETRMRAERGVVASLRALPRYVRVALAVSSGASVIGVSMLCSPIGSTVDGYLLRLGLALTVAAVALHRTLPSTEGPGAPAQRIVTLWIGTMLPLAGHLPLLGNLPTHGTLTGFGCGARGLLVAAPMIVVASVLGRRGEDVRTRGAFIGLFSGAMGGAAVELACRHHDELHALAWHAPLVALVSALCVLGFSERVTGWRRSR